MLQLHSGNTYVFIYACIPQVKIHTVAAACRAAASVKRRLHGSQCPETKSLVRAHRLSSRLHSLSLLSDVLFVVVVVGVAAVGLISSHRIALLPFLFLCLQLQLAAAPLSGLLRSFFFFFHNQRTVGSSSSLLLLLLLKTRIANPYQQTETEKKYRREMLRCCCAV